MKRSIELEKSQNKFQNIFYFLFYLWNYVCTDSKTSKRHISGRCSVLKGLTSWNMILLTKIPQDSSLVCNCDGARSHIKYFKFKWSEKGFNSKPFACNNYWMNHWGIRINGLNRFKLLKLVMTTVTQELNILCLSWVWQHQSSKFYMEIKC